MGTGGRIIQHVSIDRSVGGPGSINPDRGAAAVPRFGGQDPAARLARGSHQPSDGGTPPPFGDRRGNTGGQRDGGQGPEGVAAPDLRCKRHRKHHPQNGFPRRCCKPFVAYHPFSALVTGVAQKFAQRSRTGATAGSRTLGSFSLLAPPDAGPGATWPPRPRSFTACTATSPVGGSTPKCLSRRPPSSGFGSPAPCLDPVQPAFAGPDPFRRRAFMRTALQRPATRLLFLTEVRGSVCTAGPRRPVSREPAWRIPEWHFDVRASETSLS